MYVNSPQETVFHKCRLVKFSVHIIEFTSPKLDETVNYASKLFNVSRRKES